MNMNSLIHSVDSSFGSRSDSSQSSVNSVRREHDERTVLSQKSQSRVDFFGAVLLLVRIKRWRCSSKHHGCSGKWWSCVGLRGMCSSLGMQWWSNEKRLKSIQANVVISTSAEAPTSVFAASSEPFPKLVLHQQQTNLPDGLAQFKITKREQFIENATASAVKKLTIKATYKDNMVKFSFTILDGLEKLNEMVATRFQLRLGSFKLKYVDEDGDLILIACDTDLMLLVGDPRQPVNQPVTRLLVLPIAHASNDA